jgi:hypothetical protein
VKATSAAVAVDAEAAVGLLSVEGVRHLRRRLASRAAGDDGSGT